MNKKEMIREISQRHNCTQKDTKKVIDAFLEEVMSTLEQGNSYHQKNFGTFKPKFYESRTGYNPTIKKKMRYPQKNKTIFTPSVVLKRNINE
ncbi:MAG: HU family DNA-binding protein [Spirochaetales bacterium]|nr:HU family DNA-binding protein [Spirochaetales bacterium]